jgi:hypothetical protein
MSGGAGLDAPSRQPACLQFDFEQPAEHHVVLDDQDIADL